MNTSIKNLNEVTKFEDFNVRDSFRAHMYYEEITGETFQPKDLKSILIFFYSCVMAANKELPVDFEAFVDWLDDHPDYLTDFTVWFTDTLKHKIAKTEEPEEGAEDAKPFHDPGFIQDPRFRVQGSNG